MQDVAILNSLQKAVTAAVQASTTSDLPVAYIQRKFTKPANGKYLEIVWIPNNPPSGYWGNERDYQGMLRLVLHWPTDDASAYAPLGLLQSICSYFTKGRVLLDGVKITDPPTTSGSPIAEGAEMLYAASLRYQSFRAS